MVVRATPTAVQVEGSGTWYHLSRCTKVPGKTKGGIELKNKDGKNMTLWCVLVVMHSPLWMPVEAVELETQRGKQSTPGTRATPETNPHDRGDRASESDEQCLRALGRQVTVATGLQKAQMLDLLTPSQMAQLSLNDSKAGNGDYMDLNPNPACVSDSDEDEQSQV
ncbi:Transposon Tf2-11 polyprotein [Xyrichtys novacula]|uniref:Transposon Tf2-11 polyprotein n=1 Tax=Xyrichtys novacula TaxID=13765 RepID=A0AAV1EP58_XYRNO|nr:Transposon Tf2-11 polyprotein [Xyrichtys novacula]